jgi:hypothetical protein
VLEVEKTRKGGLGVVGGWRLELGIGAVWGG